MTSGYALHVAAALFGSTSWLCINAVWMELSLLMHDLPESDALPSYLDVIIQIACALILIVATRYPLTAVVRLHNLILMLLAICIAAQLALVIFWRETTILFGITHSLPIFALVFILACVAASSNILFMPYMARFHATCLTAYFVGMGVSALVPSVISLFQGTLRYECVYNATSVMTVFEEARFSVRAYFLIVLVWLCAGTVSFITLNWFPRCLAPTKIGGGCCQKDNDLFSPLRMASPIGSWQSSMRYWTLLACLVIISAEMNSIVMSVQIYSVLPYSLFAYHMALTLSAAMQSVFCLLPMWIKPRSLKVIVGLTGVSTAVCAYIVKLALMSPTPPLRDHFLGSVLSVSASMTSSALNAYLRTLITSIVSEELELESSHIDDYDKMKREYNAKNRLFWCGALMQIGSTLGAIFMFPLINVMKIFKMAPFCP